MMTLQFTGGLIALLLLCGCSSITHSSRQKADLTRAWTVGDTAAAEALLVRGVSQTEHTGDELMWRLEAGSLYFDAGRFDRSIAEFRRAEELIAAYDDRPVVSIRDMGAEGGALLTNLNALPYRGWYRDRVMLGFYKSLAYLGQGNADGFLAQLRRMRLEEKSAAAALGGMAAAAEIERLEARRAYPQYAAQLDQTGKIGPRHPQLGEYEAVYQAAGRAPEGYWNPAAAFLSGIGLIAEGEWSNAGIEFRRLAEAMPENPYLSAIHVELLRRNGEEVPPALRQVPPLTANLDRDCVYVIFANGRGANFGQTAIYFPVMAAWPVLQYYPAPYHGLVVESAGFRADTAPLADLDALLSLEFRERLPGIVLRIVLSTLLKEGASHTGTVFAWRENEWAGLGVMLGSAVYRAVFNTADTRSWELNPRELQLAVTPIPADRRLRLIPLPGGRPQEVRIPDQVNRAILYVAAPEAGNCRAMLFAF